jgi:hypothetical protein
MGPRDELVPRPGDFDLTDEDMARLAAKYDLERDKRLVLALNPLAHHCAIRSDLAAVSMTLLRC